MVFLNMCRKPSYVELVFHERLANPTSFFLTSDLFPDRRAHVSASYAFGSPIYLSVLLPPFSLRGGRTFPFDLGVDAEVWSDEQPYRAFFVSFAML
jgi:hypothetical protein